MTFDSSKPFMTSSCTVCGYSSSAAIPDGAGAATLAADGADATDGAEAAAADATGGTDAYML